MAIYGIIVILTLTAVLATVCSKFLGNGHEAPEVDWYPYSRASMSFSKEAGSVMGA